MIYSATGHRPGKSFGWQDVGRLRLFARDYISQLSPAPREFVTGMALGWDTVCAWACVDLSIPFVAAVSFKGQDNRWPRHARDTWKTLLGLAKRVHVVCDGGYAAWKLQRRNEWMTDYAGHLLALWDGSPGGTANCLAYAARVGKPVTNLWEQWKAVSRG